MESLKIFSKTILKKTTTNCLHRDFKTSSSVLKCFWRVCKQRRMFVELLTSCFPFLALAHQYSFPYKPFQINDQARNNNWFRTFLAMLDMEDVRADLSEHFGVVGDRIGRSFRSHSTNLQYSEADYLINPSQQATQVVAVSRVKNQNYGTVHKTRPLSDKKQPEAIGKDNKKYRIADIEDKDTPQSSGQGTSNSNMTQSTASTSSSFGINVRAIDENDPINYRNPDV